MVVDADKTLEKKNDRLVIGVNDGVLMRIVTPPGGVAREASGSSCASPRKTYGNVVVRRRLYGTPILWRAMATHPGDPHQPDEPNHCC